MSWCLADEIVGLEELDDGKWLLHFRPHALAIFDTVEKKIRPLGTALAAPNTK